HSDEQCVAEGIPSPDHLEGKAPKSGPLEKIVKNALTINILPKTLLFSGDYQNHGNDKAVEEYMSFF
ncbi:hypothetical protein HAX54_020301, partial [Datura stramonium]|nr:hypothetical protein [Datura stramonium]